MQSIEYNRTGGSNDKQRSFHGSPEHVDLSFYKLVSVCLLYICQYPTFCLWFEDLQVWTRPIISVTLFCSVTMFLCDITLRIVLFNRMRKMSGNRQSCCKDIRHFISKIYALNYGDIGKQCFRLQTFQGVAILTSYAKTFKFTRLWIQNNFLSEVCMNPLDQVFFIVVKKHCIFELCTETYKTNSFAET